MATAKVNNKQQTTNSRNEESYTSNPHGHPSSPDSLTKTKKEMRALAPAAAAANKKKKKKKNESKQQEQEQQHSSPTTIGNSNRNSSLSTSRSSRWWRTGTIVVAVGAGILSLTLSSNNSRSIMVTTLRSVQRNHKLYLLYSSSTTGTGIDTTNEVDDVQSMMYYPVVHTPVPLPPIHYNGTWVGNHWMPAASASATTAAASATASSYHLYTPQQLADYWKDESILIMGDSTARRFYATLYELIYHGSDSDSSDSGDGDGDGDGDTQQKKHKYPNDVRVDELDAPSIIDVNKKGTKAEICNRVIGGGDIIGNNDTYKLCRTMPGSSRSGNSGSGSGSNTSTTSNDNGVTLTNNNNNNRRRRFDLANIVCISEVSEWLRPPSPPHSDDDGDNGGGGSGGMLWKGGGDIYDYTVIVIAIGPWELNRSYMCPRGRLNNTQETIKTLDMYANYVANKVSEAEAESEAEEAAKATTSDSTTTLMPPRIVWRTWPGLGQDNNKFLETHKYADQMNTYMKKHIDDIQRKQWQRQQQEHQDHDNDVDAFDRLDDGTSSSTSRGRSIGTKRQRYGGVHSVSYVDWGHIMVPRSSPVDVRIKGDIDAHTGLEARLAMIQALTNHLAEQDRQLVHDIPPWSVYTSSSIGSGGGNRSGSYMGEDYDEYHCRTASPSRREEYCSRTTTTTTATTIDSINAGKESTFFEILVEPSLSAEEQALYEIDQRRYCEDCAWSNTTMSCEMRLRYAIQRYDGPRHFHLHNLLEQSPECIVVSKTNEQQ